MCEYTSSDLTVVIEGCVVFAHSVVNESLPIFLDSILGQGIAAVFISTGAIVICKLP